MAHESATSSRSNVSKSKAKTMANDESTDQIRKQIKAMPLISGPQHTSQRFIRINGPGRAEQERLKNHRNIPEPRNLHLYEDDSSADDTESKSSGSSIDFLDENKIRASVLALGINHSNTLMEQRWRHDRRKLQPSQIENEPRGFIKTEPRLLTRDQFAKNALMSSLLKQQEKTRVNGSNAEGIARKSSPSDSNMDKNVGEVCSETFLRDPLDPDFFYRPTRVTNKNVDFTVEHVGKVTIVGPRKFVIQNYDDKDFEFSRGSHRRSKNSRGKKKIVKDSEG